MSSTLPMLTCRGQDRIVEDPFGVPLSSSQAALNMHPMFVRISRDFSMVSPCVTNPTGCNNVLLAIRTSISPSAKVLGCALQLLRLIAREFVSLNERFAATVPHWIAAIEAKTGLTIESVSAASRE